jgi:hypothetical protein
VGGTGLENPGNSPGDFGYFARVVNQVVQSDWRLLSLVIRWPDLSEKVRQKVLAQLTLRVAKPQAVSHTKVELQARRCSHDRARRDPARHTQ